MKRAHVTCSEKTRDELKKLVQEMGWTIYHATDLALSTWIESVRVSPGRVVTDKLRRDIREKGGKK